MTTADAGITSRAFFSRSGSPPAMSPMIRELTASPAHPQVITKPMAVPVMRGKASPTIASVVGKTGAMESPARKTSAKAVGGRLVRSIRKVVIAMAADAKSVTVTAGTRMRIGETPTRPINRPSANPSEKNVESARFGNPLRDEVSGQPIPDAHLAADVEKKEEPEQY